MRAVGLARAVADPQEMPRPGQPLARGAVEPGQRLFVFQQQRLVAGVEIHRGQFVVVVAVQPGGVHEIQRVADARGQVAVFPRLLAVGEAQRPLVDAVHVGKAARGKGAQQVQRARRLGVGAQHLVRIGDAGGLGKVQLVDDVAAIAGQLLPVHRFGRGRARLGELPGHAPHLYRGHLGAVGQHHGHLQHHLEGVADVVGVEIGKALGAVAALQQEGLAARHGRQFRFQAPRLAGEDQRRIGGQPALDLGQGRGVGILRHLHPRLVAPVGFGPFRHCLCSGSGPGSGRLTFLRVYSGAGARGQCPPGAFFPLAVAPGPLAS